MEEIFGMQTSLENGSFLAPFENEEPCASCGSDYAPGASKCRKCFHVRGAPIPDVAPRIEPKRLTEAAINGSSVARRRAATEGAPTAVGFEDIDQYIDACAACGCGLAPGAHTCRKCSWPLGVLTVADKKAQKLGARLQDLVAAAAAITNTGPAQLESKLRITPFMDPMEMCEGAVAVLEDMLPAVRRQIDNGSDQASSVPDSLDSSQGSGMLADNVLWEANSPTCNVCRARLGKRRMNPRHHCRACGKCVCAKCSPSMVKLSGTTMMRVCTRCVESAFSAPGARRFSTLPDSPRCPSDVEV